MKIHEYQAKEILREYGIPTPEGEVVASLVDAEAAAVKLGFPVMVKAQIHAGGRGKAGGVKEAGNLTELKVIVFQLLGKRLVTAQTAQEGLLVAELLIQKKVAISRQIYLGITADRQKECPVIIVSRVGGVSIEETAKNEPEKILKDWVDLSVGLQYYQLKMLAYWLGINGHLELPFMEMISKLYQLFRGRDCLLAEINPLVITENDQLLALDAKIVFDDNALFRQPNNSAFKDTLMENALELEAKKIEVSYVKLAGAIGCMVNGAGLAMATMDAIDLFGEKPANFLDVGGGASPEKISAAFKILASDPSVKVIFINIFGGISRCDIVAEGILMAHRQKKIELPLVLRFAGTNASLGLKMLMESGIKLARVSSLSSGAKKSAELARSEK